VGAAVVQTPAGKSVKFQGGTPWHGTISIADMIAYMTTNSGTGPRVKVTLSRPFWLANREVTVAQFKAFVQDAKYFEQYPDERLGKGFGGLTGTSKTADSPVPVRWEDTALYCNWLSRREGLEPCYKRQVIPKQADKAGEKEPAGDIVEWVLKQERSG